jgi:hypothetical protein
MHTKHEENFWKKSTYKTAVDEWLMLKLVSDNMNISFSKL